MKDRTVGEEQGQPMAVTVPHGQFIEPINRLPGEWPVLIVLRRDAGEGVDDEDETEPVLTAGAETRPGDRAPQAC